MVAWVHCSGLGALVSPEILWAKKFIRSIAKSFKPYMQRFVYAKILPKRLPIAKDGLLAEDNATLLTSTLKKRKKLPVVPQKAVAEVSKIGNL